MRVRIPASPAAASPTVTTILPTARVFRPRRERGRRFPIGHGAPSGVSQGVDTPLPGNDHAVTVTLALAWAIYLALLGVLAVVLLRSRS